MPTTKPGLIFNKTGKCGACLYAEKKNEINWVERKKNLKNICDTIKKNNDGPYDCVIPVSGGKDSFYQTYVMKNIYGMRPLVIVVPPHVQTIEGIENINNLVDVLEVDLQKISVKPSVYIKFRLLGMHKLGNPNYAEHAVVFAGVTRAAFNYKIPLIVWGEDIGMEFGGNIDKLSQNEGSALNIHKNDLFNEVSLRDLTNNEIDESQLYFYLYPKITDMEKFHIKSIYLSNFHKWDGKAHYELAKKYGFKSRAAGPLSGNILSYDNIDEKLCEIHIWFKMLKFGFWRPTDQTCYQIWNSRMSREEAVEIVLNKQYEFPNEYIEEYLEYHQISENELFDCMEKWRNHDIWKKQDNKWKLRNEIR